MQVPVFLLLSVMMAGAASASSFVTVAAPQGKATASTVVVTPPPAVSLETAASVDVPPEGIDPTVTLSYPFAAGEPPRELAIIAAPAPLKEISPSIMAMEVRPEDRLALAKEPDGPFSQPVVIRGGIVGDPAASPEAPAKPDQPQVASDAEPPAPAAAPEAPATPEPVAPPSPSPAAPVRAPE
jgi:hypothetical protein